MSKPDIRDHIIKSLKEELIGPSTKLTLGKFEEGYDIPFFETPRSRYGAGILFSQKCPYQDNNDDEDDIENNLSDDVDFPDVASSGDSSDSADVSEQRPENDYEVTLANEYLPSAMGISALVDTANNVLIEVSSAYYIKDNGANSDDGINRQWKRRPVKELIEITADELNKNEPFSKPVNTGEQENGLKVHIYSRPSPLKNAGQNDRIVTFTLINSKVSTNSRPRDEDCYFQSSFSVKGMSGTKPFLEYPENYFRESLTEEEEEMALLYRHRKVFAVGHGCSAAWSAGDGDEKSEDIETRVIPEYEVPPVLPSELGTLNLDMWFFGNEDKDLILKECSSLADQYKSWIEERKKEALSLPEKFKKPALRHIDRCLECSERISEGIDILSSNEAAYTAFSYMNQSMFMQHFHYDLSTDPKKIRKWVSSNELESKYVAPDYGTLPSRKWRPFQLAFILMSIKSIVDEQSDDRDIVDLIWFPTGGGKTEAYLGLGSFTIFFRRLTDAENTGTTAIMRYTLRLLTTQQFQRAASLICSMEKIRRDNEETFGRHPITIGLWVGSGVTPNKEASAKYDLNELTRKKGKNKFLISSCPWCGAQMGPTDYDGDRSFSPPKGYKKLRSPDRVRHVCEDPDCDFSDEKLNDGLPLQIIDQHIYKQPPTLLIGTVDKFAMMPWVTEARRLFALDEDQPYDPPSLIIQDEMHLISGPLGSMVGLYETVIDALCEFKKNGETIRPKIVASTATVSNAEEQIKNLFARKKSMLFPPQGLKAGDSFFAEEHPEVSGRKYVGVFATGLPSQMTTMVRTLASLIQAPVTGGFSEEEIDPYWTLMAYFNSVRELGHACTLVRSDIPEYLNVISNIRLKLPKGDPRKRYIRQDKELTSRISSDQVTEILNELFKKHQDGDAIDVCLATNMIQVGLDVSRLSLMVIAGQPKTTSEYIQASSRVGRSKYPGLVFTALSPSKPRDRSHYEHFTAYHQSFYKYVEPTSVTPFSVPVRDRALHALIITFIRYWGDEELRSYPDRPISGELKQRIQKVIEDRLLLVDKDELITTMEQIGDIWKKWETLHPPKYGSIFAEIDEQELMVPSSHNQFENSIRRPFSTPTSMRNVDSNCEAEIITEYEGAD